MRTKRYVDGGSVFTPVGNRQQPNVNMPQPGQPQPGQPGQPGQQPAVQPAYPFQAAQSGMSPQQQINVGEPTAGRAYRKGGYVKAADGIAQRGKTKGRMA